MQFCSDNLVGIVTRLTDRGIDVVSATYDTYDCLNGKTAQVQIELNYLYHKQLFKTMPPNWLIYDYHTIVDSNCIGPKYTGIAYSEHFTDSEELEFASILTISNLELWLDSFDIDGFKSVLKLYGYAIGRQKYIV